MKITPEKNNWTQLRNLKLKYDFQFEEARRRRHSNFEYVDKFSEIFIKNYVFEKIQNFIFP